MSQSVSYNNFNDAAPSRRYTGFPLNSTLVSSYTPDTIRSIISHAAAAQPYSTPVWIRLSRVGIQVSAQDPQVARTRIPVFIPIGLSHDIFMLPSINNVICIVYDEVQSNMKGVLLYVVHPSDAQSIRDDFRIAKQAHNGKQQNTFNTGDTYPSENSQLYSPISSKSPLFNSQSIRQPSPRRIVYVQNNETNPRRELTPAFPQLSYTPSKGSYHSDRRRNRSPKKHRSGHSPSKRSSDSGIKQDGKHASQSPDKRNQTKLPTSRSSPDLAREQIQQQQQLLLQQQQQQLAAWQAQQQAPLIPMGIYNRYVPKTIPLPTGETLKTTLPPAGIGGVELNGAAVAYIEPLNSANAQQASRSRSRSISPPSQQQQPQQQQQQYNRLPTGQSTHHHRHHRRHHTTDPNSQTVRARSKNTPTTTDHDDIDDETKLYLKVLVEEMQAMKMEMNKLRQASGNTTKGRSDSLQVDLKEIRSHIDQIRSRMALTPRNPASRNPTPRIPENPN